MNLPCIPLSNQPVEHPRNPFIKERSDMSCGNAFLHHIAHRALQVEVERAHKSESERYAEQWVLAA